MDAMQIALDEAAAAAARGEVPVGAVVLDPDGAVLARAGNATEAEHDASAHAELRAMRAAARLLGSPRLLGCDVVASLEPCAMCAGAMVHFRVRRLVFGAYDPKGGGVEHGVRVFDAPGCLHRPEVIGGVQEAEAAAVLRNFFKPKRPFPPPLAGGGRGEGSPTTHAKSMRQSPAPPERALWNALRGNQLGVSFRRQAPIGGYIVDFCCHAAHLIIELDGATHVDPATDAQRTAWLEQRGYRVLRFWNNEVMGNLPGVLAVIVAEVDARPLPRPPPARGGGEAKHDSSLPDL